MRRSVALIAATFASVVALAACGGSSGGLIPPSNAQTIGSAVTTLTAALAAHNCTQTRTALHNISSTIAALPSSVDRRLLNNLEEGENTLAIEAPAQCKAPASTGSSGTVHHHKKPSTTGPTGATNSTGTSAGGTPAPTGQTGTTGSTTSTSATGSTTSTGPTDTTSVGGGVGPGDGSGGSTSTSGTTGASTGGGAASG